MPTKPRVRTLILILGGITAAGLVVALLAGPALVERHLNRIAAPAAAPMTDAAKQFHDSLFVADLHSDLLLWDRDPLARSRRGHTDVPRLVEGGVRLQVFSTVTKVPPGLNYEQNPSDADLLGWLMGLQARPIGAWTGPLDRALAQAAPLRAAAEAAPDRLVLIRSVDDLDAFYRRDDVPPGALAGVLSTEGLHATEGDLRNLNDLFDAGFRMIGLAHFFDNSFAGSAHGMKKGGLTELGRRAIRRMERLGIAVDLAHASPQTIDNVLALATRPVFVSHTGVQGTCPGPRNLTDRQLDAIALNGGVIGIGFWGGAVCAASPAAVARAVRYAVDRIGVGHIALGSDFDGAVTVPFDATQLGLVTQALLDEGLGREEIRRIMGENVVRVLRQTLPPH